jgi:hypothetical protein
MSTDTSDTDRLEEIAFLRTLSDELEAKNDRYQQLMRGFSVLMHVALTLAGAAMCMLAFPEWSARWGSAAWLVLLAVLALGMLFAFFERSSVRVHPDPDALQEAGRASETAATNSAPAPSRGSRARQIFWIVFAVVNGTLYVLRYRPGGMDWLQGYAAARYTALFFGLALLVMMPFEVVSSARAFLAHRRRKQ